MNVAVVGAGLAGLAAACELADLGHSVTVFERRPWAGGKTYSFVDRATGDLVDNGQHVFMACTTEYIAFLRRLGTLNLTRRQRHLAVPVFDARGRRSDLRASALRPPFHLASSFLRYRHVSPAVKLQVARLLAALPRPAADGSEDGATFADWLAARGQSPAAIERFWDFLVLPTLNCRSSECSAAAGLFVLREGFLRSPEAAALGVSAVGLSELHVQPAVDYLGARRGVVKTGSRVDRLTLVDGAGVEVSTADGVHSFDAAVVALPPSAATHLLAPLGASQVVEQLGQLRANPIVNVHLWFDRHVLGVPFAAFVDSELQWVFRGSSNAGRDSQRLVISLSAAHPYMNLTRGEAIRRLLPQVRAAIPAARDARLLHALVLKDPEATFVPAPGLRRPESDTGLPRLALAGAYTDTGWPATMESAVRSGLAAARDLHVRCLPVTDARPVQLARG